MNIKQPPIILIDELLLNFRNFLTGSWDSISKVLMILDWDESPYFLDDWIQANWELLVESQIEDKPILTSYGFNDSPQCRYKDKNLTASHRIICWNKIKKNEERYIFRCFVSSEEGSYKLTPPFDYAEVFRLGQRLVIPVEQLSFGIEQI